MTQVEHREIARNKPSHFITFPEPKAFLYAYLLLIIIIGLYFCLDLFPVVFGELFRVFWGLMVFIGICSVLQLSSLICRVFVAFGVWIPQARDILNTRDDENGHEMS